MGINAPCAALLARARQAGVVFTDTLTIGRMGLAVPEAELTAIARTLGLDPALCRELARDKFADRFFRVVLGAENLRSIDFSHYQDASILHDLNRPVPADLHDSCDVLYDGGTMEHVFDVRQVLTNYMTMVKPGGRIFINVPANNLFGHGFYQFSTEFFYRVFDPANGFAVRDMLVIESPFASVEVSGDWRCYRTLDPAEAGTRIRLVSNKPQMIFVEAERIDRVDPFAQPPMQSDYRTRWDREAGDRNVAQVLPDSAPEEAVGEPFAYLTPWQSFKRTIKQRQKLSLRNRKFFTRTNPR